jgi:hypothetical protein
LQEHSSALVLITPREVWFSWLIQPQYCAFVQGVWAAKKEKSTVTELRIYQIKKRKGLFS